MSAPEQITLRQQLELGTKVIEHIERHPEGHENGSWFGTDACGTTRCIAGWTLYFAGYEMRLEGVGTPMELRLGAEAEWTPTSAVMFSGTAADLLGMDPETAHDVFFEDDNDFSLTLFRDHIEDLKAKVEKVEEPK